MAAPPAIAFSATLGRRYFPMRETSGGTVVEKSRSHLFDNRQIRDGNIHLGHLHDAIDPAESNEVFSAHEALRDLFLVDEGAVGAAEVFDRDADIGNV